MKHRQKLPPRHPKGAWWKNQTRVVAFVDDNINQFGWMLCIGHSAQEAINHFAKKSNIPTWDLPDRPSRHGHFAAYRPLKRGLLWFPTPVQSPGAIAHECYHAICYLIECMDSRPDSNLEELTAYYLEFLTNKVFELCQRINQ